MKGVILLCLTVLGIVVMADQGQVFNFTPHSQKLYEAGLLIVEIPSSGNIRLNSGSQDAITGENQLVYNGQALPTVQAQSLTGMDAASLDALKKCKEGDSIIVSQMVATWLISTYGTSSTGIRVYVPATGPRFVVRDEKNAIIGVTSFEYHITIKPLARDDL